jgi:type IV pilus assembly protein PilE
MIAMAIIAILTGISWPTYVSYMTRSSRSAAQTQLLELAGLQEKIYQDSNSYSVSVTAAYNGRADGGLGRTAGTTDDAKYTLTMTPTVLPTQTFLITATPVAGTSQEADGAITISSNGTRQWFDPEGTVPW